MLTVPVRHAPCVMTLDEEGIKIAGAIHIKTPSPCVHDDLQDHAKNIEQTNVAGSAGPGFSADLRLDVVRFSDIQETIDDVVIPVPSDETRDLKFFTFRILEYS